MGIVRQQRHIECVCAVCTRMESETMKTRQLPRNYMARDSTNCSFPFLLFRIYLLSRVHTAHTESHVRTKLNHRIIYLMRHLKPE